VGAKTVETALVVIPPREAWGPIQAIRRQHDRRIGRLMPHLTLAYPFRPRDRFDEAERLLLGAMSVARRFHATLTGLGTFRGDRSVTIWTSPAPSQPFRDLQRLVVELFPDCDDVGRYPGGYVPHLTLGQAYSMEDALAILADLRTTWQPIALAVREVALIAREGDHPFSVVRTLRLGTTALSL